MAVQLGAFSALERLLAAGAELGPLPGYLDPCSAWWALSRLPATKSTDRQLLVQRMAALLLDARPLSGDSMKSCHESAVWLAFPERGEEPCPWLLDRLLRLHNSGELGATQEAAQSVDALLHCLLPDYLEPTDAGSLDAAVAQWLRVPAAQHLGGDTLVRLARQTFQHRLTAAALPALLQLEGMRDVLLQEAQGSPAVHAHSTFKSPPYATLVAAAASTGQPQALDAVLAAGGTLTLQAVTEVVENVSKFYDSPESSQATLRLLLSRHAPPVPAEVPDVGAAIRVCPLYSALCQFGSDCELVSAALLPASGRPPPQPCMTVTVAGSAAAAGMRAPSSLASLPVLHLGLPCCRRWKASASRAWTVGSLSVPSRCSGCTRTRCASWRPWQMRVRAACLKEGWLIGGQVTAQLHLAGMPCLSRLLTFSARARPCPCHRLPARLLQKRARGRRCCRPHAASLLPTRHVPRLLAAGRGGQVAVAGSAADPPEQRQPCILPARRSCRGARAAAGRRAAAEG